MSAKPFDSTILADAAGALGIITNVLESSTEYSVIGKDLGGKILLWNEGARHFPRLQRPAPGRARRG